MSIPESEIHMLTGHQHGSHPVGNGLAMSEETFKALVRQTARGIIDESVEKIFMRLGVDVTKAEAVLEFQDDQRFMRRARKSSEDTGRQIKNVSIGLAVVFFFTIMGLGIRAWLKQQGGDVP